MLTMVIANPILLTIVNAEPFDVAGAFCATRVENKGESATTAIPQINIKAIKASVVLLNNKKGEIIQQTQDSNKTLEAVLLTPIRCDINPLMTHEILPEAIIKNDQNGTL